MRLSVVVPTVNRDTLDATLRSVAAQRLSGDELVVVGADPAVAARVAPYGGRFVQVAEPGYDWGGTEKAAGMRAATGDYVAFMDDDDAYADGARQAIERAAEKHPGQPLMFRMQYRHDQAILWRNKRIAEGNVGSPMLVAPNRPEMLGTWGRRYGNDFDFISSMRWPVEEVAWVPTVIALIGGCDGRRFRKVSVLVPTRGRVPQLRALLKSFDDTVFVPGSVELVFRVDADDPETLALLQETEWNVVLGPAMPASRCYDELAAVAKGELLVRGRDDMRFDAADWQMHLLHAASQYPDGLFELRFGSPARPYAAVPKVPADDADVVRMVDVPHAGVSSQEAIAC